MASEPDNEREGLAGNVRRGLLWGSLNSLALRLGSLLTGIVLARLLAPEDFGVYAIALTVQSVLLTLADLGMSVDLVRADKPEKRAPTVATVSLVSGALLALSMCLTAGPVASLMGAPDADTVIMVLAVTLVISGGGVVPYAMLQREFHQRKLFATSLTDFGVGTATTLGLILLGMGPLALAIGRVVAQIAATSLQFKLAHVRPRFGFDVSIAKSALVHGIPLGLANLLSWALINVDNVVIARIAGPAALGLYVLAFNVSSWPMSAIGQAVRSVSLAGFSRTTGDAGDGGLRMALSLTWAAALPAGVLLAALSNPLIGFLYGDKWSASAAVLAALGLFGALRVALDLIATYLVARGASRPVLWVQLVWFGSLIPAVVAGAHWKGVSGAAWAHLVVSIAVVLPAYLIALHRLDVAARTVLGALWVPVLAGVPTWLVAHEIAGAIDSQIAALVLGGLAGITVYVVLCWRWLDRVLPGGIPVRRRSRPVIDKTTQPEGA